MEHLLFYGAVVDAENVNGNTPLHVCAVNNRYDLHLFLPSPLIQVNLAVVYYTHLHITVPLMQKRVADFIFHSIFFLTITLDFLSFTISYIVLVISIKSELLH